MKKVFMDPKVYEAATKGDLTYLPKMTPEEALNLPSQLTQNQDTVLHIATEFNQQEFVKIVTRDYCPSLLWQANASGDTALHIAAREDFPAIVKIFVDHLKTDIEAGEHRKLLRMVNLDKDTALHCAARLGNHRSVELLVEADPEVCIFVNDADESPLFLCVASGLQDVTELFIKRAPSSAAYGGPYGLTALHMALLFFHHAMDTIKSLVGWRKQMIREGDHSGMTPLHYAALYKKTDAVKLFLEYDSSATYLLDNDGDSPMHIAAFHGFIDVLQQLMHWRPDCCYLINKKGRTILHAAVLGHQNEAVKFILKQPNLRRFINKQDKDGNTPLHLAALFKFCDLIEILAKGKGIKLNIRNKEFLTALGIYLKHNQLRSCSNKRNLQIRRNPHSLEVEGTRARITVHHLRNSEGMGITYHDVVQAKERMGRQAVVRSRTTTAAAAAENFRSDSGKQSALDINLLVATLVATVTFAAAFQMPGGYEDDGSDQGLATFTKRASFQVFVVFNTLAFSCSVFAVFLHFLTSLINPRLQIRNMKKTMVFTTIALVAMVVAFSTGSYVVLTKSIKLAITPFLISGCFAFLYLVLPYVIFFSTMIPAVGNGLLSVEDFLTDHIELYGNI